MSDGILVFAAVVQAITAVVVAYATVKALSFNRRLLEVQIPPQLSVVLSGPIGAAQLDVINDAGCHLSDVALSISSGVLHEHLQAAYRRCVYTSQWASLPSGSAVSDSLALDCFPSDTLLEDGREVTVDFTDIVVEYEFLRTADRRRFSFRQRVGVIHNSDGMLVVTSSSPEPIASVKKFILRRIPEAS